MHPQGVMIHDDIGWGEGMARAWSEIQRREGPGRTTELWQGNRPSRGVIFLGSDGTGQPEIRHMDRLSQRIVRKLKGWQRK